MKRGSFNPTFRLADLVQPAGLPLIPPLQSTKRPMDALNDRLQLPISISIIKCGPHRSLAKAYVCSIYLSL